MIFTKKLHYEAIKPTGIKYLKHLVHTNSNISLRNYKSLFHELKISTDNKIRCIKDVRTLTGYGLRDSKEFVDEYQRAGGMFDRNY